MKSETEIKKEKKNRFDHKKARAIITELYKNICTNIEKNTFDEEAFRLNVKNGLKNQATYTALLLLYTADAKGLHRPNWVKTIIQDIAEEECIGTMFRVRFIKGLIKLNQWKLAVSFLDYKTNAILRNIIFYSVKRAIDSKNINCMKELPRQGNIANRLRGFMGYEPGPWRRMLASACWYQLVNMMSARLWNKIDYVKLPVYLLVRSFNAFMRHDNKRFSDYIHSSDIKASVAVKLKSSPKKEKILPLNDILKQYDRYFKKPIITGEKHGSTKHNS